MRAMTRKPARTLVVLLAAAMVAAFGVASPAAGSHPLPPPVVALNPIPAGTPFTVTGTGCLNLPGHGSGGTLTVDVGVVNQADALVAGPVTAAVTAGAYGPVTLTVPASTPPTNLTTGTPAYQVVVLCYRERGNGAGYDNEGTGGDPDGTDFTVGALAAGDDLVAVAVIPLVVLPCVLNCGGGGGGGGAPSEVSGLGGFDDLGAATPIDGVPRFTG